MMLYKNMKAMVCSPDGGTDFFDIVSRVLQEDTLVLYLFILYLHYILWTTIDLIKNKIVSYWKKQEANNIPKKLWSWIPTV